MKLVKNISEYKKNMVLEKRGSCRKIVFDGNTAAKTSLSKKTIRISGRSMFKVPARLYCRIVFGARDFNELDFRNYRNFISRVPERLKKNFEKLLSIETRDKQSTLTVESITDFDGNVSKNLAESGKVSSRLFWHEFQKVIDFLTAEELPLLDITARNICVKRINKTESIPVFIDFKRMSARIYPLQIPLYFKTGRRKKILRRAKRIIEGYKA